MQNYTKQCPTKIKTGRKYLVLWHKGEVLVMSESRLAVGSKDTNSQEDSITSTVNFFFVSIEKTLKFCATTTKKTYKLFDNIPHIGKRLLCKHSLILLPRNCVLAYNTYCHI